MPRSFCVLRARRAAVAAALMAGLVLAGASGPSRAAGNSKQLQRVRGTIGYQTAQAGDDFKPVFGKFDLPDDDFAATRAKSAAVLALPDSSLVALGENTTVQAGAFNVTADGPGSTITVDGGSLRFDIKRPAGGTANYIFKTSTSQTSVRGTIGLLSFVNGVTTIGCVVCQADSVTVTTATQTVTLVSGQFVTISATGVITTGALTAVAGAFTAAGVPITPLAGPVAAGVPAGTVLGIPTTTAVTAGAAAAVTGTAIGIAVSQPSPKPSSTAGNAGSGSGQGGNLNLDAATRVPHATAIATSQPPAARPVPAPALPSSGRPGR